MINIDPGDYHDPVRRSDGKVFSCVYGAAYAIKYEQVESEEDVLEYWSIQDLARQVVFCCEGVLQKVRTTQYGFSWAKDMIVHYADILREAYTDPTEDLFPRKNRVLDLSWSTLNRVINRKPDFLDDWITMEELAVEMNNQLEIDGIKRDNANGFTGKTLSRHFKLYAMLYERTLGISGEIRREDVYRQEVWMLKKTGAGSGEYYKDLLPEKKNPGRLGRKILNKTTGEVINNVKIAAGMFGVREIEINVCCLGDIPYVLHEGQRIYFVFNNIERKKTVKNDFESSMSEG